MFAAHPLPLACKPHESRDLPCFAHCCGRSSRTVLGWQWMLRKCAQRLFTPFPTAARVHVHRNTHAQLWRRSPFLSRLPLLTPDPTLCRRPALTRAQALPPRQGRGLVSWAPSCPEPQLAGKRLQVKLNPFDEEGKGAGRTCPSVGPQHSALAKGVDTHPVLS